MRKNDNRQTAQLAALLVLGSAVWFAGHLRDGRHQSCAHSPVMQSSLSLYADADAPALQPFLDTPLDINTASGDLLAAVPGIGPKLAGKILVYRQQHGPLRHLSELKQIPGIGEQKLAAIAGRFEVQNRQGRGGPALPPLSASPRNGASPP